MNERENETNTVITRNFASPYKWKRVETLIDLEQTRDADLILAGAPAGLFIYDPEYVVWLRRFCKEILEHGGFNVLVDNDE